MKITSNDITLRLVDTRRPLGGLCWLWAALAMAVGAYQVATYKHEITSQDLLNSLLFFALFAGFPFVIDQLSWVRRDFQFDKNSREFTWQRRTRFSTRGGTVPFSAIQDAAVEAISIDTKSGGSQVEYQLMLRTTQGKLEVAQSHMLSLDAVQKQCEEPIACIRAITHDRAHDIYLQNFISPLSTQK